MQFIIPSLSDPTCFPVFEVSKYEYHDWDECPTASKPCPCVDGDCIASCADAEINDFIYSPEFDRYFLNYADPFADVDVDFDDLGQIDGDGDWVYCDQTQNGTCTSCSVSREKMKPIVEYISLSKARFKLKIYAKNAYWGGPYGYSANIKFYFEPKSQ